MTSANANPDSDHTSMVSVSGQTVSALSSDGITNVGTVTASQTMFNSGGQQSVALTIEATHFGPVSGVASLNVVTAEDPSVHDNTSYAPILASYNISNVGLAAVGGADPANASNQLLGAPLSGTFVAGSHLSSRVAATGTSGAASTATHYDLSTLSQTWS